MGWKSIAVGSGQEAIRFVKGQQFDLILLDLVLGGMNGADTLREIRRIDPSANVVIITAYPSSDLMHQALEEGGLFGLMRKPITQETLHILVGKHDPEMARSR